MKIMIVDNNNGIIKSLEKMFEREEITECNNIIELHGKFVEENNDDGYEHIFLDLTLAVPPSRFLKKINIDPEEITSRTKNGSPIIGWDYFKHVMLKHPAYKDILPNVTIISAYSEYLVDEFQRIDTKGAVLLDKFDVNLKTRIKDRFA